MSAVAITLAERGLLPDVLVRIGIRRLLHARLQQENLRAVSGDMDAWVTSLSRGAVAEVPELANRQHYEVPPAFFHAVLGPQLKYSSCLYEEGSETLERAEEGMLALTAERAGITDGMRVLELGCGWGSLTLWLAKHFPGSRITGVSNSALQRQDILSRAARLGLSNVEIITADMNDFRCDTRYDRVVSVEMFEHMHNVPELLRRVSGWLAPGGRLFLHVFCHRCFSYPFEDRGRGDWMARHFFSGGMMPAEDLYGHFDAHLKVLQRWVVPGTHYARTSRHWLEKLDANRVDALTALGADREPRLAERRVQRWRMFFMACEELFGARGGREWFVSHQLLGPAGEPC